MGYGNSVPDTIAGKIVGSMLMIFGAVFMSMPLAIVGNNFMTGLDAINTRPNIEKIKSTTREQRIITEHKSTPREITVEAAMNASNCSRTEVVPGYKTFVQALEEFLGSSFNKNLKDIILSMCDLRVNVNLFLIHVEREVFEKNVLPTTKLPVLRRQGSMFSHGDWGIDNQHRESSVHPHWEIEKGDPRPSALPTSDTDESSQRVVLKVVRKSKKKFHLGNDFHQFSKKVYNLSIKYQQIWFFKFAFSIIFLFLLYAM